MAFNRLNFPDVLALWWRTWWLWKGFHREVTRISKEMKSLVLYLASEMLHYLPLTGSQCIRGLILLWHSPSEFHQGSLRFLYLLQQEIWPLAFITSLFSLNTNLSLYTQSHVFFTVSPFLCPPPGLQAHWSRAAFHTCAARCARHILVSKQELRLAVAKSNHSCSTISCRVGVASVYWFIPGCR